ncbi:UNVERIFIED_CONTAM: hypothetical protein Sangu_0510600 [Sesamum angustifolium]|uniref:Myb/SANT-like domain-containing protein n=1 Tax=Sesamum angustifolium TaxID=2727405 RepID=A0AAW2Q8G7_9LAMI
MSSTLKIKEKCDVLRTGLERIVTPFQIIYEMTRNAFGWLCHILHEMGGLRDSKLVSIHEQVTMFVSVLAHHKKNCTVKYDFIRSGRTVSRHFLKVCEMDVDVIAGVRCGAGRKEGKLSRRIWSFVGEESLLVAKKEIARNGWKSDNGFRTGYLGALEQLMNKSYPNSGLKSNPHISSKIQVWKKTYSCLSGMLSKSEFGWDGSAHVVTDNDDVFHSYFKVDPFAPKLRHKSFPYYPRGQMYWYRSC